MTTGTGRSGAALLAAERVDFRYRRGADPVIWEFEHAFEPGSMTVITGPSGCGKSTLLYLLGLLLQPTAGRILWQGVDASARSDADRAEIRARAIGFVFQDALLDPSRSILANVTEGALYAGLEPSAAEAYALELLGQFGVDRRATHRPGEISGGQAQRVALCRALIKGPQVILADEPSGNLDEASADLVWTALGEATKSGAAVAVATHDRRRAATADAVIEL
ncbi:MAG: ATP-binding cassette domain-containing protein [Chloroflexota bacterium]